MLPKANRLPSPLIRSVLRAGRRFTHGGLQLVARENNLPTSRFAVIVPTSVDARAVVRNRIRRASREAIRGVLPRIVSGWDCVVFVRRGNVSVPDALRAAGIL